MMKGRLACLRAAEGGATAIEYALIGGAVALGLLTAYWTAGDSLRSGFADAARAIDLQTDGQWARGIIVRTRPERD